MLESALQPAALQCPVAEILVKRRIGKLVREAPCLTRLRFIAIDVLMLPSQTARTARHVQQVYASGSIRAASITIMQDDLIGLSCARAGLG